MNRELQPIEVETCYRVQEATSWLEEIAGSLATIAAIQQRRERAMVTRKLQRLEHLAGLAEKDAAEADRMAAGWPANDHRRAHYGREKTAARLRADRLRREVNEYRLIYQDVLTLGDVAQPEPAEVAS